MSITENDIKVRVGKGCQSYIFEFGAALLMINKNARLQPKEYSSSMFPKSYALFNLKGEYVHESELSVDQAVDHCNEILRLSCGGNYKFVSSNNVWRKAYGIRDRTLLFAKHSGNGGSAKIEAVPLWVLESFPCAYCGIILPIGLMQVDHRQPQYTPDVAVVKIIRTIGGREYTLAPSTGQKASAYSAKSAPGAFRVGKFDHGEKFPCAENAGKGYKYRGNKNMTQKYSLTPKGQAFLSICAAALGLDSLKKDCVNSYLNLVPSCASCNGGSGKGHNPYIYSS